MGHPDFVRAFLLNVLDEHDVWLSRIPMVEDVQWALLLHCAGGRANYTMRVVRPEVIQTFAEGHADGLWRCLRNIWGVTLDTNPTVRDIATMPLSLAGWVSEKPLVRVLPHSGQVGKTAFPWSEHDAPSARWETPVAPAMLLAAQTVAGQLVGVEGFDPPSWEALADRQRPPRRDPDDSEPGDFRHVRQHEASSRSPVSRGAWAGKAGRTLGCAACMRSSFGKTATSEAGGRPSTMQFVVVTGANRG